MVWGVRERGREGVGVGEGEGGRRGMGEEKGRGRGRRGEGPVLVCFKGVWSESSFWKRLVIRVEKVGTL